MALALLRRVVYLSEKRRHKVIAMLAERLAAFALAEVGRTPALALMRRSVFDWAVCSLAGCGEPVARILVRQAREEGGVPRATIVGEDFRVPARMAALVNGTISHALDYDDTHFAHIGHPSVAVVPAALATAELVGARGAEMLEAALIGAEGSVRIGQWLGRGHYQAGFHQTATAGAFGAVLAAGRLLGLDRGAMMQALGLVATRAAGLKSQFGSMGKPLNAGQAAALGVETAQLAAGGFCSAPAALDGAQGFGATHAGEGNLSAFDDLGHRWRMEGVSYKFHACCHGLHAMLNALSTITEAVAPDQIEHLRITSHPRWASVCNLEDPVDGLQCKFSFRHTAAMMLAGRDTGALEAYSDEAAHDRDLTALRKRVAVEFDQAIGETEAVVLLILRDGSMREARHDLADPLPGCALDERLQDKGAALVGPARAAALWEAVAAGPDLADFLRLIAAQET